MLCGVVVFGGAAIVLGMVAIPRGDGFSIRGAGWPIMLLLAAGVFAGGIFMSPREFKAATNPDDEDAPVADWLKDLRRKQDNGGKTE